jgi:hypothetical protein
MGFAGLALGGILCGWHSPMTPVFKTEAILDPFCAAADRVHPHALGIFRCGDGERPARRAFAAHNQTELPGFWRPGCSNRPDMYGCHGYATRSPRRGDAQRSGQGFDVSGPGIRGVETSASSAVIHTPLRESGGRSACHWRGCERTALLASARNDLSYR